MGRRVERARLGDVACAGSSACSVFVVRADLRPSGVTVLVGGASQCIESSSALLEALESEAGGSSPSSSSGENGRMGCAEAENAPTFVSNTNARSIDLVKEKSERANAGRV